MGEDVKLTKNTGNSQLYDWMSFIAAETEEDLAAIVERNPQMSGAVEKLRQLSADERIRDLYEQREKARRDMESQEGSATSPPKC